MLGVVCFLCLISIISSTLRPENVTMTSNTAPGSIMYRKVSCADRKVTCAGSVVVKSAVVAVVVIREYVALALLELADATTL